MAPMHGRLDRQAALATNFAFDRLLDRLRSSIRSYLQVGLLLSEAFHLEEPVGGSIKHRIHGLDLIPCDIDLLGETAHRA